MRRGLAIAIGAVVVLAGVAGLLAVFNARDDAGLTGGAAAAGPGTVQPDRGARHGASAPAVRPGELPTSGEHRPVAIGRDRTVLTGDQWLHALEQGNVILAYGDARPPAALAQLQEDLGGPYDPELAAAGQSVILARVEGLRQPTAVAWRRLYEGAPDDPAMRAFAETWLGTGAPE